MKKKWQPKPLWNRCQHCGLLARGPECKSKDDCKKELIKWDIQKNIMREFKITYMRSGYLKEKTVKEYDWQTMIINLYTYGINPWDVIKIELVAIPDPQ